MGSEHSWFIVRSFGNIEFNKQKSKYSVCTVTTFSKARAVNFKDSMLTKRIEYRLSTVLFYQLRVAVTSYFV